MFLDDEFVMINQDSLLKFGYLMASKRYVKSLSLSQHICAWYFRVLEQNLGNQAFSSLKYLRYLKAILDDLIKRLKLGFLPVLFESLHRLL